MTEKAAPTSEIIKPTKISGLYVIERPTFPDERGFFHEVFRNGELKEKTGLDFDINKLSHSYNKPGVLRGIHSEKWNKLVYPATGKLFVAIADVRPESETFSQVETFIFDADDLHSTHAALLLPPGIGNSLCVMGDKPVDYFYVVDEEDWNTSKAEGVAWDDPDLNIKWPIINNPIISKRDREDNPRLRDLYPEKFK